jgi:hypothetical protein
MNFFFALFCWVLWLGDVRTFCVGSRAPYPYAIGSAGRTLRLDENGGLDKKAVWGYDPGASWGCDAFRCLWAMNKRQQDWRLDRCHRALELPADSQLSKCSPYHFSIDALDSM